MKMRLIDRPVPPLLQLAGVFAGDFVSSLAFAGLFSLTHSLSWSVALALVAGGLGIAWTRARGREVGSMQWASLILVLGFGAAALFTHDPRFVMLKPTVIYLVISVAMLKPGWMRRYLPAKARVHGTATADAFGYIWAAAMGGLALANLALVLHGDMRLWAGFLATAPLSLKLALGATQYVFTRRRVVRAIRRETATASVRDQGADQKAGARPAEDAIGDPLQFSGDLVGVGRGAG